jgi:hypothetical protein
MLIEAYLRQFEDALLMKASESAHGWPAYDTGLSTPSLSKIPRSQLLAAIRQASVNAAILFPKGPAAGLYGRPDGDESTKPPPETLAPIALSPLSLWIHAALADALNGGKPDVFFSLLAQILRDLTKPDEQSTPLAYVTMVHEATIELVREAYESHKETGKPEPWEVLGIPTFMPTKLEVKRKAVGIFGQSCTRYRPEKEPGNRKIRKPGSTLDKNLRKRGPSCPDRQPRTTPPKKKANKRRTQERLATRRRHAMVSGVTLPSLFAGHPRAQHLH